MNNGTENNGIRRRDFFKALAAGGATAAVAAGCADRTENLIPYVMPPDNIEFVPGVPLEYATTCAECPAACGMVVKTREGRAIKAEGNPDHPLSQGALCIRGQSSLQSLYNPARISAAMVREGQDFKAVDWETAEKTAAERLRKAGKGRQVVLWTTNRSGTRNKFLDQWVGALGGTKITLEPLGQHNLRAANQAVFGRNELPLYRLDQSDLLVNFGADLLETFGNTVRNNRDFAAMHAIDEKRMTKGKMFHVAPHVSMTGANADEWVNIAPGSEAVVALALAARVSAKTGRGGEVRGFLAGYTLEKASQASGASVEALTALADEIARAKAPLAVAGGNLTATAQGTQTHIAVNVLNAVSGAVGKTYLLGAGQEIDNSDSFKAQMDLVARMKAGQVKALIVDGANPLYHLPKSAGVAEALAKVETIISVSSSWDETTRQAHVVLPSLSAYESWGDANPQKGVWSLMQPVMAPVYKVKASENTLISLAKRLGAGAFPADYKTYLQNAWKGIAGGSAEAWKNALQKGGVFSQTGGSGASLRAAGVRGNFAAPALTGDGLVLLPANNMRVRDGSKAQNPWLQEIPDPVSQVVWTAWADINPETGKKLGLRHGQKIRITSPHGMVVTAAFFHYGIHEDAIAIPMGYGHHGSGSKSADDHGVNVLDLLPASFDASSGEFAYVATRVKVEGMDEDAYFVQLDGNPRQEGRGLIQTMTLEQVKKKEPPHHGHHAMRERPDDFYRYRPRPAGYYQPYRWGMVVDVDRCTGCSACVAACYAENNIPVVGRERMWLGREMSWIRIERFLEGRGDSYKTLMQPAMCQQCGNAGCEPVCPIYATYHTPEGLNAQVYNRCVGTRYCSNNCVYKQRRYNWFQFEFEAPLHLQLNPDVSVRSRGVMEKCTFCSQRIMRARHAANEKGRDVMDGEITPACVQTCPTNALVFGNLADPTSRVAKISLWSDKEDEEKQKKMVRQYRMLEELKVLPAVTYLRKVTHKEIEEG